MRSTGSQNSRTVAYWKAMRVSRSRWCSPILTRLRSAGVSVSSKKQVRALGPHQCVRAAVGPRPNCVLYRPTIVLEISMRTLLRASSAVGCDSSVDNGSTFRAPRGDDAQVEELRHERITSLTGETTGRAGERHVRQDARELKDALKVRRSRNDEEAYVPHGRDLRRVHGQVQAAGVQERHPGQIEHDRLTASQQGVEQDDFGVADRGDVDLAAQRHQARGAVVEDGDVEST